MASIDMALVITKLKIYRPWCKWHFIFWSLFCDCQVQW